MKNLLKQQGVTLVEVLVSIALMGIVSMGVMQLSKTTNDFTKKEKLKADDDSFLTLLDTKLSDPAVCEQLFKPGLVIYPAGDQRNIVRTAITDGQGKQLLKEKEWLDEQVAFNSNKKITTNLFIDELYIEPIPSQSAANIVVTFSKRDRETKELLKHLGVQSTVRKHLVFLELAGPPASKKVVRCLGLKTSVDTTIKKSVCELNTLGGGEGRDSMESGVVDPNDPTATICVKKSLDPTTCSFTDGRMATGISPFYDKINHKFQLLCSEAKVGFSCTTGFFKKFNADGSPFCAPLTIDETFLAFNDCTTPTTCGP
jgi:prepilin-type N-terminal cleavage/methylation domain-containing protein